MNRGEVLKQIREKLSREPDDDDRVIWGRWFLAAPATRTISPYSKLKVPEYIENRIKENTPTSLAEAEQLAFGNAALLARISPARSALEKTPQNIKPATPPATEHAGLSLAHTENERPTPTETAPQMTTTRLLPSSLAISVNDVNQSIPILYAIPIGDSPGLPRSCAVYARGR